MKTTIFKIILAFSTILFFGCANQDYYDTPSNLLTTYELIPTKTVQAIVSTSSTPVLYNDDDVIEAYVTSSDEQGNFYKSISFQSGTNTAVSLTGFSVPVNSTSLFVKGFHPGRKVYIKLKGLYIAKISGSTQIGSLYNGTIGRISEIEWQNHLFPSATVVSEEELVRELPLTLAYSDTNINTLVDLIDVQFSDSSIDRTYYDVDSGGGATNHDLVSTVSNGSSQIIRFSSFAPFSGNQVATGSGEIRGVMSKYSSTYQFLVRFADDIKLDAERKSPPSNPLGGTAQVFSASLNENFTSYALNTASFPKYINDQTIGGRYWAIKNYSSNNYIEMTSYGGGGVNAKSYFMVPVDFTAASTFTFKKEARYFYGPVLKVYYVKSQNFTPGFLNVKDFTDITASFSISYPATGSSENSFTSAGNYTIPTSLTGNGYFVFEYAGTPTVTTTMQIDDIVIN